MAQAEIRNDHAVRVIEPLGKADRFFADGVCLSKFTKLGEAPNQVDAGGQRGSDRHSEALKEKAALQELHVPSELVSRSSKFAQGEVGPALVESRRGLKAKIPQGSGDREGAIAGLDGSLRFTRPPEVVGHIVGDLSQP